jgi:tetratricopeptide (TPR) repeat protein
MNPADRVAFYRAKCLACHDPNAADPSSGSASPVAAKSFAATHHPENPDCASCHMPRSPSDDIAHEQVTDHRIPRIPAAIPQKSANPSGPFVSIGTEPGAAGPASDRDLGLAYALAASRGDRHAGEQAIVLLTRAEAQPSASADAPLHEQLGFLHQLAGDKDAAARDYQAALVADAHDSIAAGDLALLKAGDHQYAEAVALWQRAFAEDPVQLKAGMNLAIVECGLGRKEAALGTLERILTFSPDDGKARELLRGIQSGNHSCGGRTGAR